MYYYYFFEYFFIFNINSLSFSTHKYNNTKYNSVNSYIYKHISKQNIKNNNNKKKIIIKNESSHNFLKIEEMQRTSNIIIILF